MQMKVPDFQPSRRRRHNHAVDRCMLPIQPSPIKLPSLSAAGTFRARARERERSAFWLEPLKTLLIRYSPTTYSLQITFVPFLNVSPPQSQRKKQRANFCESVSIFLSCSFVPLYISFFIASFVAYSLVFLRN